MVPLEKPLPYVDGDTRPFWEGCAKGELRLQRCLKCGAYRHPPSPICQDCLSPDHEWIATSGRGTVYTFVIVHRAFNPAWESEVPYVVAVIELAEGPHILSNVVDVSVNAVHIGMPVKVRFELASEEISLPKFAPLTGDR